jgi:predicted GNAT superfamily acetyltransferase
VATPFGAADEDIPRTMRHRRGVTREIHVRDVTDTSAVHATKQAQAVAGHARVRVAELTDLESLQAAAALYQDVWQTDLRTAPVSPDLMRALSHAGGYVAGAFDGGRLVAASLAFHTDGAEAGLHSHISAVLPDVQGRDVGRALKLHQRAWALERGITTISWTYDPLLRRNAWFNVTKLAARAVGYLVDFYGIMDDAQNVGDESDRVVALWSLEEAHVEQAADGERFEPDADALVDGGAVLALRDVDGRPRASSVPRGTRRVLVQIPADIQVLRRTDPALARAWRETGRSVLDPLLAGPYVATGFTRSGCYLLEEIVE